MLDNDNNIDNQILFAIDQNGQMFSVPEIAGEESHFQPYRRLNIKIDNKLGNIYQNDTSRNLPKRVVKLGFINIYPKLVFDTAGCGFVVVFPMNKTKEQLQSLETLYGVLEKKEGVGFYKKTIPKNEDLYFMDYETGLEELKCFVKEELEKSKENQKINEGR